jgi:phosphoribosylformylglycinamidine cyclo-ligase
VDDDRVIDGGAIEAGDVVIGLSSSGVHSNGYSLARRALLDDGLKLAPDAKPEALDGETLGQVLMRPTRLYVRQALEAIRAVQVRGMAHITGGGLEANANRVMPEGLRVSVDFSSWRRPAIFGLIAEAGVEEAEMRRVFNLGIGFVLVVESGDADALILAMANAGESARIIGSVVKA